MCSMDAITENRIRQEQVESFGRLMAGFSHDMKNHLGIIRESNGLMGDLLSMSDLGGDVVLQERLQKAIGAIENRVQLAAHMLHHLSGLAHRPDIPLSSFQINDIINEECVFLERFTRLQKVSLALELQEGLPSLYSDPALLQHVIYRIFMLILAGIDDGGSLTILTEHSDSGVFLVFRAAGPGKLEGVIEIDATTLAAVAKLNSAVDVTDTPECQVQLMLESLPE